VPLLIPSVHQTAPCCIYAFHLHGALSVATVISPLFVGPNMESLEIKDKKSTKCRDSVTQRHLLKFAQQGASQSGEPPQGTGTHSKPTDVESPTKPTAKPSGLTEQGASTDKPAVAHIMFQKLPIAKSKLSGAAPRKLKKVWAGQSGTRSLIQLRHENSPQPSIGPKGP
jgi:hypothetical protein